MSDKTRGYALVSEPFQKAQGQQFANVVELVNAAGSSPIVLVCEHASNFIPDEFGALGLDKGARQSHIAWDPGALGVARAMSQSLAAPLVAGRVSRLIYDCNRPPTERSAIPERSEVYAIAGNIGLSDADRQARIDTYYIPFRDCLADALDARIARAPQPPVLVTIHSFTRVYDGVPREVEIGILHDSDTRLADELLRGGLNASAYDVQRNAPYGPGDGVTHTLKEHGLSRGLANVMIEIRNDLIADEAAQIDMARLLTCALRDALDELRRGQPDQDSRNNKTGAVPEG